MESLNDLAQISDRRHGESQVRGKENLYNFHLSISCLCEEHGLQLLRLHSRRSNVAKYGVKLCHETLRQRIWMPRRTWQQQEKYG